MPSSSASSIEAGSRARNGMACVIPHTSSAIRAVRIDACDGGGGAGSGRALASCWRKSQEKVSAGTNQEEVAREPWISLSIEPWDVESLSPYDYYSRACARPPQTTPDAAVNRVPSPPRPHSTAHARAAWAEW
eukprot:scaffold107070_cov72-Phaeocystis_antarctica.AAC.11